MTLPLACDNGEISAEKAIKYDYIFIRTFASYNSRAFNDIRLCGYDGIYI